MIFPPAYKIYGDSDFLSVYTGFIISAWVQKGVNKINE